MKTNPVMAIAIGHDEIVGVKAYKIEGTAVLEDVIVQNRHSDMGTDIKEFFDYYGETGISIGCVFVSPLQSVYMETPMMHKIDQYLFAQREGKRIFQNEEFPNAIDFASRPGTTEELMFILIVALERNQVKQVARGIQQGGGNLCVIDYWPAPLAFSRGRESSMLCITPEEDKVRVSLWNDKFCTGHTLVSLGVNEVLEACETVYEDSKQFQVPYPKGAIVVGFDETRVKAFEPILETYGTIDQVPLHIVDKGENYNPQNINHEMAFGLAIRLLTDGK
ncbi:hypothetical protein [Veillonella sp. VA137]|uniref:hypothetical protein n=1 Tax=Veillonella sp. VA137 TaxID=741828 RepID=UPI000F8E2CFC|nr:hypothetical protein [Veillonella sp. VA137]